MGRGRLRRAHRDGLLGRLQVMNGDRRQAHDGAVACAVRAARARRRVAGAPETLERRRGCHADVEAPPVARHVPLIMPAHVALHLVMQVKAVFEQAGRQAQGHAGVVDPLAGKQLERASADHVGQRRKRAARLEFDRCADGVPHGQAQQGAAGAVKPVLRPGLISSLGRFTHHRQSRRTWWSHCHTRSRRMQN